MKLFTCGKCGNRLYFDNTHCARCGTTQAFLPDRMQLLALEPTQGGLWQPVGESGGYRLCGNYTDHMSCNWAVSAQDPERFCLACRLNRVIPDLGVAGNLELWRTLEGEKRRLVYSLLRLGLPVLPHGSGAGGLGFDFLADTASPAGVHESVLTGHRDGLITINIAEADAAERERIRDQMDEPYRTLLGHFRHESGHYYWDRLVRDTPWLEDFRRRFGDERSDYAAALQAHYDTGPPADWQQHFVSAYASVHPWEDWAETWAHYLHITETLETAWQFGLQIHPRAEHDGHAAVEHDFDPFREPDIAALLQQWFPLSFALNSLNRSMGHPHAYPFVLSPMAIEKLGFVHEVIRAAR
ncbi:MAG: putative zinc-binding peptidase [Pseudazoarcus pumilus]|nr:putative zinc-binding peptidase [Pseudazoarcus pumilus]